MDLARATRVLVVALIAVLIGACGASAPPTEPGPSGAGAASVRPSPTASPVPATSDQPPPSPSAEPDPLGGAPAFDIGTMLVTVSDRVRVRSKPSISEESARYEPVLPLDTALHALEGPVSSAGYWWYRVELAEPGQHLTGGTREGWVAVADHDGTPWVDVLVDVTPGPPAPPTISGLPTVQRDSTVLSGDGALQYDDGVSLPIEIHGLLPGTEVTVEVEGSYEIEWVCGGGPEGELGAGMTDAGTSTGSDATRVTVVVGDDGVGRADPVLAPAPPTTPCPSDFPGPKYSVARQWDDLRVRDSLRSLELTPPPFESADTF